VRVTALVALTSRVRRLPPARQDALLAAIVSAGMVVESGVQLDRSVRPALTIVLVLLIGASLAWRRRAPAVSTVSALIGLGLFVRFSEVPDWTLPLLVIALDFFTVGAADYSRRRLLATGGLLLGGLFVVVAIDPQDAVSGVWRCSQTRRCSGCFPSPLDARFATASCWQPNYAHELPNSNATATNARGRRG
jgi:hypothetical protein